MLCWLICKCLLFCPNLHKFKMNSTAAVVLCFQDQTFNSCKMSLVYKGMLKFGFKYQLVLYLQKYGHFLIRLEQNGKMWSPSAFDVTFSHCCYFMLTQMVQLYRRKMLLSISFTGLITKQLQDMEMTWVIKVLTNTIFSRIWPISGG